MRVALIRPLSQPGILWQRMRAKMKALSAQEWVATPFHARAVSRCPLHRNPESQHRVSGRRTSRNQRRHPVWCTTQPTEWQRIGNEIEVALVFAWWNSVNVHEDANSMVDEIHPGQPFLAFMMSNSTLDSSLWVKFFRPP